MFNKKGITLISLVVTIIVIIILASIVIAVLTSEDKSTIKRATEAKNSFEESQEIDILKVIFFELENKSLTTAEEKRTYITNALTDEGIEDFEVFDQYIRIKDRQYQYSEIAGFDSI